MAATTAPASPGWKLAADLEAAARLDTVLGDLYLGRARELLAGELGEAEFRALERTQTDVEMLPGVIRNAMEAADWKQVKELGARLAALKERLQATAEARAVAQRIYGFEEVLVDPFSPGLHGLAGVVERDLPALRDRAVRQLERLRDADPEWRELYAGRARALRALAIDAGAEAQPESGASVRQLQAQAARALASGDMQRLQEISSRLLEAEAEEAVAGPQAGRAGDERIPTLTAELPAASRERAPRLGLAAVRVASTREQVAGLYRHAWQPTSAGEQVGSGPVRVPVSLGDAPEALRERLEMFLNRPFVNSAGARFLPYLVEEDALVEGFEEPVPGAEPPNRPMLEALGLDRRAGLSRIRIERALLARGAQVVRDVGLDPRAWRLVCIPPDLHLRVGMERGWGNQPQWTHLDGYMVQQRKFLALAGGDARFGGVHDLVGLGRDYDSDRLIARFAVVQRARMAAW